MLFQWFRGVLTEVVTEIFYKKRCSYKFLKIQRKTPVPESLIQETLLQDFFSEFPKFVGPLFITNHLWRTASAFRTMSNIYDRTFLWKQQVVTVFEKKTQPQPCTGVSL